MNTAYSYIRFSSLKQRLGASEARQEESPEPWCKANGYVLDTSLKHDRGRSGYHGDHIKHGALGVFLKLVEDGQIKPGSVLLIEHLDRFTRQDPFTGMAHLQDIIKKGVDIVTLMDGERYNRERLSTDMNVYMKLMFTLFQSHTESKKKSERLLDVWRRKRDKAQKGVRVSKRCPAWIDKETGELIPDKADVIRKVFALAAEGVGINTIARLFNREGVPPIGKGKRWSGVLIRYYLTSRTVLGEFQSYRAVDGKDLPEGPPVIGLYPAVVAPETFFKVARNLSKRTNLKGKIDKTRNLFTGIL